MNKIHCSLSYHNMELDKVESFCLGVKAGYFGHNPPFTVLPLTELAYEDLIKDYVFTRAAYVNGGELQKGPFLLAKAALMEATDSLASATDKVAKGDAAIITLAGFEPTKTGNSEGVKPGQCVVTVKRGIAGELISNCALVTGAKHYGCIMVEGGALPDWVTISADGKIVIDASEFTPGPDPSKITGAQFDLTDQREKHFTGLKHDATYYFYYYAVNATGVGPLSEVVSMVCW